ncbi:hypothetical protein RFE94_005425, partial [Klebsiella pneumoniae]|nr:hypothetical protein [Klebsiella pneumoniae]
KTAKSTGEKLENAQGMETYWKTQCRGITDHCEELQARIAELESHKAALLKFIRDSCYVFDGADEDISDAYVDAITSGLMPKLEAGSRLLPPLFWVRVKSDGGYEGPIHDSKLEYVRKKSGEWLPLALARGIPELESRAVMLPPELYTIGELIRTQDNRITDQPMFVVFQKREIIGSDEHSPSRICWVWDGEEVSELRAKRLEALYQDGRDTRGYDRYAMQEVDEFVTACFTEHGCKDYLRQNGHNLRLPYIYACGSFRNNEYQLVRNWLAGIKVEAE